MECFFFITCACFSLFKCLDMTKLLYLSIICCSVVVVFDFSFCGLVAAGCVCKCIIVFVLDKLGCAHVRLHMKITNGVFSNI